MVGTRERRPAWIACALAVAALAALCASPLASALRDTPGRTHINDKTGRFVPIPDSIPHVEGAYIDKRIKRNLAWIARHFRIYVTEGFAGRLPRGPSSSQRRASLHGGARRCGAPEASAIDAPVKPSHRPSLPGSGDPSCYHDRLRTMRSGRARAVDPP